MGPKTKNTLYCGTVQFFPYGGGLLYPFVAFSLNISVMTLGYNYCAGLLLIIYSFLSLIYRRTYLFAQLRL